jgi:SEC-C motif-containing protein
MVRESFAPSDPCPCGSTAAYRDCCGRLHAGLTEAATAEELMRSRYSAFVAGDSAYLLRSWSSETRPRSLEFDPEQQWEGLDVIRVVRGGANDTAGTVEFRARFRTGGAAQEQHEVSTFVREDGRWVYRGALALR